MKGQLAKLGKNTLIYGLGQGLAKLIGFLMLPLLTKYLTPEDYGVISLLTLVSYLAAPIFGLGFGNSVGVVYFSHPEKKFREQTIWTSFSVLVITSLLLLTVSFVYSSEISTMIFQTNAHSSLVKLIVVSTIFNGMINQPFIFRLQFEEKSKTYVAITSFSTLLIVGLTVIMVIVMKQGVYGYLIAMLTGNVVAFFVLFFTVIRWTPLSVSRKIAYNLIRSGIPMISSFFLLFILETSGRFLLERFRSLSEVGIYSIGHTFAMAISLIVSAFTTSWFPYFNSFSEKKEEAKHIFGKLTYYYLLGFGTLTLLMFIFAKPLVFILTKPAFHEAYLVVGLISLANMLVGVDGILMAGLYLKRKVYMMNYVQLGAAVLASTSGYFMIPHFGIIGAALSLVIGYTGLIILQVVINSIAGTLEIEYQWSRIFSFAGTALATVALTFIPRDFTTAVDILFSTGVMIVLITVLYLQLDASERDLIRQVWRDKSLKSFKL